MKKEDLILLVIAVALLLAMIITFMFGGADSRHGVGSLDNQEKGVRFTGGFTPSIPLSETLHKIQTVYPSRGY
ncbi:hypothetical protein ACFL6N_02315 [Thermodesulfobacteriota bacterium]